MVAARRIAAGLFSLKVVARETFAVIAIFVAITPYAVCQSGPWQSGAGTIYETGSNVGIGTTTPQTPLDVMVASNQRLWVRFVSGITQIESADAAGTADQPLRIEAYAVYLNALSAGNVGIGTANPTSKLTVVGGNIAAAGTGVTSGLTFNNWNIYQDASNNYNIAYDGGTPAMTVLPNGNIGVGTVAPPYLFSVKGTIGAQEVIVTNTGGWSDYVFDGDYRLAPLSEVAAYVNENHHLPDIPSAQEVKERGISLGDMQAKLLAKIEELTLHMIAAEKENSELRERVAHLEKNPGQSGSK